MRWSRLTTAALLAVLLCSTGVAALPAPTTDPVAPTPQPVSVGGDERPDTADSGPPDGMPSGVPDHVERIHDEVHGMMEGDFDQLGRAIGGGPQSD